MHEAIRALHVWYVGGGQRCLMGRLVLQDRSIDFSYDDDFLARGLSLSPMKLPLKPGIMRCDDRTFDGLFGIFNDSLPDGWGRLLVDRKLMALGLSPQSLTPLDRLQYVGHGGMGALAYEPEIEFPLLHSSTHLDHLAQVAQQFLTTDDDNALDELLAVNGSSAGARPKAMLLDDGLYWLVKFRSSADPTDIAPIEYAYHLMALKAGLIMPPAKLFPSRTEPGYFGVQRFDRVHGERVHVHSISGLLHADHRMPNLDYETILKATLWLTQDSREAEKQFRACVFNVLAHNRDDHAKNFSFVMDRDGQWHVSPAYDLTFSGGPAGEHCTTIMGEGKRPGQSHLLKLAEIAGIEKSRAQQIIDDVRHATSQWMSIATDVGVSARSKAMVGREILDGQREK